MNRLWEKYVFYVAEKGAILSVLKGNNSCKTYKFRIKVRNLQMLFNEWKVKIELTQISDLELYGLSWQTSGLR